MAFTGVLRFFNTKFTLPGQRAAFLGGNAPLGLSIANLDELVAWLSLDVSSSDAACKATWSDLYAFVKASTDELVALCVGGVVGKDAVADLLTEVLRVCNFAQHDKHIINEFLTIMTRCAITVVGDPEICKAYATFKNLGFSKSLTRITIGTQTDRYS
jgi:hypothetical protein